MRFSQFKIHCVLLAVFMVTGCVSEEKMSEVKYSVKRKPSSLPEAVQTQAVLGAESIAPVLYNRKFIYNFLLKIYGATAETTLRERIFKQQNALGGSCDSYDITKLNTGTDSDPMSTCYGEELKPQVGINSSIREGWIIRACEEVGKIDSAIYFALNQIFPDNVMTTDVPMVNEEGVKAAFHLFYPTLEGNQDLIKALFDLKQREVLAVDQWKLILTTLCQSPEWRK